ncbi:peptidoglycan recognition protein 3-like [Macrosteles quadrilineatus]|uniref:peptidoglycan recognition protein 3-like n=1 Tax=Macrosteles quadrilineatus TaxID=74068 RepID=UPI0023E216B6|nr:peptidoglycan recognition protein 3-like [Macrosteles quadrilineatus]XP_054264775.1 peptidoglycan recognition protein 3-like [Macrosteles quadrilineatus]
MDVKLYDEVNVVSREEWGAVVPTGSKKLKLPAPNVIFTYCTHRKKKEWPLCMDHEECCRTLRDMQEYYMKEELMRDLPYNFIVGGDGTIYEGRGWYVKPAKNENWKELYGRSVEIAYMGDHHERRPNKKMWRAAWDFVVMSVDTMHIENFYEFIENYDEAKLDAIQAKKPWYKQFYHFKGV